MPSPRRLFKNFTTAQINELIASGFDRALNGDFTSVSGGAKSGGIEHLNVETLLQEANYELDIRGGSVPPQKVEQRLFSPAE